MYKKEQLKKILEYSKFTLNDSEYVKLKIFLNSNSFTKARLFIEELIEEKEIDFALSDHDTIQEYELKNLNKIQDLIIDLVLNEIDNVEEKQFK